jgi:hypothetical protein
VQSLLVGFQTAQAVAANGGKVETAAKSTARDILVESTHSLGDYIDRAAGGNLEKLLSSSYPLQKDRAPVDIQPAPANLRLKHGKVSGSIAAYCDPNTHRVLYEWQTAAGASPTEWQIEPSTNSARSVFPATPLAPGSMSASAPVSPPVPATGAASSRSWSSEPPLSATPPPQALRPQPPEGLFFAAAPPGAANFQPPAGNLRITLMHWPCPVAVSRNFSFLPSVSRR